MIYGVYAVRDAKTGFMTPTIDLNPDSAIRGFAHSLISVPSVISTFAKDFDLYQLGQYNSEAGELVPAPTPVFIISGSDALALGKRMQGGSSDAGK